MPTASETVLTLGSGPEGAVFREYAAGVKRVLEAATPFRIEIRHTTGSYENARLIEAGALDLAVANMGPMYEAWNCTEPWVGAAPMRRIRALSPMYQSILHVITLAGSGIGGIRDLSGRRVGCGPRKAIGEVVYQALFDGVGVTPTVVDGDPADNAVQLVDGRIDAFCYGTGLPTPTFTALADRHACRIFALTDAEIEIVVGRYPYMTRCIIPAGTYRGQAETLKSAGFWNFLIARGSLDPTVAHTVTKALMADPRAVAGIHASAVESTAENAAQNGFLPFHPGARRFYQEKGVPLNAPIPESDRG